jgi:hypothetical protein
MIARRVTAWCSLSSIRRLVHMLRGKSMPPSRIVASVARAKNHFDSRQPAAIPVFQRACNVWPGVAADTYRTRSRIGFEARALCIEPLPGLATRIWGCPKGQSSGDTIFSVK